MVNWKRWLRYGKARVDGLVRSANKSLDRKEAELEVERAEKPWLHAGGESPSFEEVEARIEHDAGRSTRRPGSGRSGNEAFDLAEQQRAADARLADIRASLDLDGDDQKDPYNQTRPRHDVATWGAQFTAVLDVFNSTPTAEAISGLLLPDVLHLDVKNLGPSTGTSFTGDEVGNILNGRTLAEDVIDFEIFVVTGGLEGTAVLTTDGVDGNDRAFPGTFPYLAPKH